MEIFGIELIDTPDFLELIMRFALNLAVIFVLVRCLYYRKQRRKDYLFTYFLISTVIFLLCFLLENVKLELGFALGLFAIFGIIRYRTQQIPIKEMSYLFLIIGVSVINALANKKVSYAELMFTNIALIAVTYLLESLPTLRHESCKMVTYDKIELIKSGNSEALKRDLEERMGIVVNRVEIGKIDFLRDSAKLNVYYYEKSNRENLADDNTISSGDED